MWPWYCCTIGYREYIEENARNFPVLERKGDRQTSDVKALSMSPGSSLVHIFM